jgi:ABC-type polysaccharide/polyol phosphate export permease
MSAASEIPALQLVRNVLARHETIRYLISSQLQAGHRDKVLGHLWNLLDPLLFVGIYFLVFGLGFRQASESNRYEFVLYLAIGVLSYRYFDATISQATACVRGQRGLIHEINFPKAVLPIAVCGARLYDFLWGLLVVALLVPLAGTGLSWHVLWLPVGLLLQLTFTVGAGLLVAYTGAFFADMQNIVAVALRLLFYASPVFYHVSGPRSVIPESWQLWYMLNPVAGWMEVYRHALLWHTMPSAGLLAYLTIVSLAALLVGLTLFATGEGKFAKYV